MDSVHVEDHSSVASSPAISPESPSADDDAFCPQRVDLQAKLKLLGEHKLAAGAWDDDAAGAAAAAAAAGDNKLLVADLDSSMEAALAQLGYVRCEVKPDGPHGKTLIVLEDVKRGQPVIKFGGPIWDRQEYEKCEDYGHCLQIGANTFLGPYDGPDDYTDHCCDPTCYIVNREDKEAVLVALRDMSAGDRVTFDYATTLFFDYRFNMPCDCDAPNCRKVIKDFTLMDDEQQKDLYERGILPKFIVDWYLSKPTNPNNPPVTPGDVVMPPPMSPASPLGHMD